MKSTTPSDPVQDAWRTFRIASATGFLVLLDTTAVVAAYAPLRVHFSSVSSTDLSWTLKGLHRAVCGLAGACWPLGRPDRPRRPAQLPGMKMVRPDAAWFRFRSGTQDTAPEHWSCASITSDLSRHAMRSQPTRRSAIVALAAMLAGSATPFNYTGPASRRAFPAVVPFEPLPRIALVLSSGGPRGYVHLGVLRVLKEAGIEGDRIVGISVGSLLGAFWADGRTAAELDALSEDGGPLTVFDPSVFADRGWIHDQRLQDYVNARPGNKSIEQLRRRLVVGATRRADKAPVFFASGNAEVAVRASSAVGGILWPVGIDGAEYEDGDESLPLPLAVRAAKQAGARFVIAVDVTPRAETATASASQSQPERVAKRRACIVPRAVQADYVIHAELESGASPLPNYFRYARAAGERSARGHLPPLLVSLQRAGLAPENRPLNAAP